MSVPLSTSSTPKQMGPTEAFCLGAHVLQWCNGPLASCMHGSMLPATSGVLAVVYECCTGIIERYARHAVHMHVGCI